VSPGNDDGDNEDQPEQRLAKGARSHLALECNDIAEIARVPASRAGLEEAQRSRNGILAVCPTSGCQFVERIASKPPLIAELFG
jgi:hypothetical protein